MIELKVPDKVLLEARDMAEDMGKLRNSITRGQGNIAGFIGEIMAREHYGAKQANTYDYDLIDSDGKRIDVKTKRTSVAPKEHYDCSVAKLSLHQDCDAYVFTRVKNDYTLCWILGMIDHDRYFELARFLKKGERDGDNGFTVKSDCYNLSIEALSNEDPSIRHRDQSSP